MQRDEQVIVTTKDGIDLEFHLAGLGSRIIACFLDQIILSIILGGILFFCFSAIAVFATFATVWGYHIFFEALFSGKTPGKRFVNIQVINDEGFLVNWKEAFIRNLIRPIDTLIIGAIFIGFDKNNKRLGDMAAGTLVVKTQSQMTQAEFSANWISRLERGEMPQAVKLANGSLNAKQLSVIVKFIHRRKNIDQQKRGEIAWKIAKPLLPLCGLDHFQESDSEALLEKIYNSITPNEKSEEKIQLWKTFRKKMKRGRFELRWLSDEKLSDLINSYRQIVSDLARARSKSTDQQTLNDLNALAILGHQVLDLPTEKKGHFFQKFPQLVRQFFKPMALSTIIFFASATIAYYAIQWNPDLAYELVSEEFLDFEPHQKDNIHDIPSLSRPLVASQIITNNIQVTILAFAFGMTVGIGTTFILIHNGIHLGAVLSWFHMQGQHQALLGWIMPHGGTEILAILIAGGAGFMLAHAIITPHLSLKKIAKSAILIEVGCMGMLLIAGLIEGFVSPSTISYEARIVWFVSSCLLWTLYFTGIRGWPRNQPNPSMTNTAPMTTSKKSMHHLPQRSKNI